MTFTKGYQSGEKAIGWLEVLKENHSIFITCGTLVMFSFLKCLYKNEQE